MSDRSGASRVILSGLAVGAILGVPAAAAGSEALAAGTGGSAAVSSCSSAGEEVQTAVASIREQFRASFTPGAVAEAVLDPTVVICEPS